METTINTLGMLLSFILGAVTYHIASGGKVPQKPLQRLKQVFQQQDAPPDSDVNTFVFDPPPDLMGQRQAKHQFEREQEIKRMQDLPS